MSSNNQSFLQKEINVTKAKIVIVYTAWNENIVGRLKDSAIDTLKTYNEDIEIETIEVPGAIEITFAIQNHFNKKIFTPDAYIALGCVIKGDTPHFDYVCQSVTQGITILNTKLSSPVIFGVLTVNDEQQAIDRIKNGKVGDKGEEAALTALHMIALNNS